MLDERVYASVSCVAALFSIRRTWIEYRAHVDIFLRGGYFKSDGPVYLIFIVQTRNNYEL